LQTKHEADRSCDVELLERQEIGHFIVDRDKEELADIK
jgi:hypothetical protein